MLASILNQPTPTKQAAVNVISSLHLAKAFRSYPKWRRALYAAGWVRGEVIVTPTIELAASVFGISPPLVKAQLEREYVRDCDQGHVLDRDHRRPARAGQPQGNGSASDLSDDAIDRLVAEVGVDRIWRALDKLTQPQLPLQAAE
jgi:hypothetical protein